MLWMTGGPGCSSEVGLFYENGPWHFKGGLQNGSEGEVVSLVKNPYSWNTIANVLYVDNPIGTGYSSGKAENYITTEE